MSADVKHISDKSRSGYEMDSSKTIHPYGNIVVIAGSIVSIVMAGAFTAFTLGNVHRTMALNMTPIDLGIPLALQFSMATMNEFQYWCGVHKIKPIIDLSPSSKLKTIADATLKVHQFTLINLKKIIYNPLHILLGVRSVGVLAPLFFR